MPWTLPAPNVLWTFGGIIGALMLSTLMVLGVMGSKPATSPARKTLEEVLLRIQSWWVMVALLAIALLLNAWGAILFFALISFLSLKEYLSLIPTRRVDRRVLLWAYLAIPLQYFWIGVDWYVMFLIFVPIYIFLFLPLQMLLSGETTGFLKAIGTLHWGVMLTVFCLGHLAYLLMLNPAGNPIAGGKGLLLYLLLLTEGNDIAQYLWGKALGRQPILPKISPKKTWTGWLGGVLTTTAIAVLMAPVLTPFHRMYAAVLGVMLAAAGFVGDVTVSALKRDLGVKDSGNLLPGHGGILDRIDSLTYTAPLFFHLTVFFYFHTVPLTPGSRSMMDAWLQQIPSLPFAP